MQVYDTNNLKEKTVSLMKNRGQMNGSKSHHKGGGMNLQSSGANQCIHKSIRKSLLAKPTMSTRRPATSKNLFYNFVS